MKKYIKPSIEMMEIKPRALLIGSGGWEEIPIVDETPENGWEEILIDDNSKQLEELFGAGGDAW